MSINDQIIEQAKKRANEAGLPYKGVLFPEEAWQLWQGKSLLTNIFLIDVRTQAEWDFVGTIPGAIKIEWQSYPDPTPNVNFIDQIKQFASPEAMLLFICRSGGRSHLAAMRTAKQGFGNCYNILFGFEGDKDQEGRRSTINGWKKSGLPWSQT